MRDRTALRLGPALVVAAVAGYLLGGCGGGDLGGLSSLSGATDLPTGSRPVLTGTRPVLTGSGPDLTVPTIPPRTETEIETETVAETTTESTTTAPEPPTTSEATTTAEAPTTTAEAPTTAPTSTSPDTTPTDTGATEAAPVEPTSSESDTPWGWIALVLGAVVAAALIGLVAWRRRRGGAAS